MKAKEKRYRVELSEREMVALFTECCCCSDYTDHSAASDRLYAKLKQIGYFRRRDASSRMGAK